MKTYTKKFNLSFRNLCAGIGTTLLALTACSKTAHYGVKSKGSPSNHDFMTIPPKKFKKDVKNEERPFCLICQNTMEANEPEEDWVTEVRCKNSFHKICMLEWVIMSNPGQKTCPACRGELSTACLTSVLPEQLHTAINNIISEDNTGRTLLHWAVINGQLEMAQGLIEKGADVNARDGFGQTPLHLALINRHFEMVQWLIEKGAVVNVEDNNQQTPLHSAVTNGQFKMVEWLIKNGADVNEKDSSGQTPLHYAVRNGQLEMVQWLMANGAVANTIDHNGITPLQAAVRNHQLEIVHIDKYFEIFQGLIDNEANVNQEYLDLDELTSLHLSTLNRRLEIVRLLTQNRANANTIDHHGLPVALGHHTRKNQNGQGVN